MDIAKKIVTILNETLESEEINDYNCELIIDSLLFIKIIIKLEDAFGCEIPASKLLLSELNTVTKITSIIESII